MLRQTCKVWREYFRRDFHPDQQSDLLQRWLEDNAGQYALVKPA
ncbi:hypothetical protein [Noviherbaspirillum cavernae]|nr:hypothetical protein [Noviherbaspirillum cavernae]